MFEIYVLWFFLPLALFCLTLWAFIKKVTGRPGREYGSDYLMQTIFCSVIYVGAVYFDQYYYESLAASSGWERYDPGFARFLIYPAFLLIAAKLQALITREDEKKKPNQVRSKLSS